MPLTDTAVRRAAAKKKPYKLFDSGGLFLIVTPKGGKWWRLKYRFHNKEKSLSLGVYPDVSLKKARERRDEERKKLVDRIDPAVNRKAIKAAWADSQANSFEVVAREWIDKQAPTWAETNTVKIKGQLGLHIFPWLGKRPIALVSG